MPELDFQNIMELCKLKREKPDEYKQFMEDFESVAMDVVELTARLNQKLDKLI